MCLVRVNASLAGTGHFPLSDKACRQILAELRIRYLWKSYLSLQSSSTPVIKNRAPDIVLDRYSFCVKSSCSETLMDKQESVCNYVWSSLWYSRVYVDSSTKIPQNRLLKQQKFIFSQFWRVEATEQGVGRFGFPRGTFLACRCPPSCWSSCFFFPCARVPLLSLSASTFCWWHQLLDCIRAQPNGLILTSLPL